MMKLKFVVPAALTVACLAFSGLTRADTYAEAGDAGDLPATAQIVAGAANTPLTLLTGSLTLTNGISDSDMFQIYIINPTTFSASMTAFSPGSNNFDSQLMLFTSGGLGVEADDDDPNSGSAQSNLPAGNTFSPKTAGLYYLLVSGSGRYASSAGGVIFPNFTDGTTDPTVVQGPTGAGGGSAITGYTGSSNFGGAYRVALSGAQFVVVPEPGSVALLLAGAAGVGLILRQRRR